MQLGEDVIHLLIQKPVEFLLLQIRGSALDVQQMAGEGHTRARISSFSSSIISF